MMHWRLTIAAAAAAVVFCAISAATVRGQAPTRAPMAEEVFKNIQVLKGVPVDQFMGTMGIIAASVGRGCSECHVLDSSTNWTLYAEDTPLKEATRRMLLMTRQINDTNFGGRQVVTCYSCHHGMQRPKLTPSLVALYSAPPDEPDDVIDQAADAPKADQVFDKYLTAISTRKRPRELSDTAPDLPRGLCDAVMKAIRVDAGAAEEVAHAAPTIARGRA